MNKPVCAVIGGSGFLGSGILPELKKVYEVIPTSMRERPGGEFRTVDIREPAAVKSFLDDVKPDLAILLAAYREPDFCEEHPEEAGRLNTAPAAVIADTLPAGVPFLFVSTDYVFDGDHPPYREDAERNPVSVYGRTKKEAEDIVLARSGAAVLRVPLLMGWTDDPEQSGFFSHLINDLKKECSVELDHVLKRYPVWTCDVGGAMRTIFEHGHSGVFHFSTTRPLTRYAAAVEMGELLGWKTDHVIPSEKIIPRKARRPVNAALSMDKWTSLGYAAPQDFKEVARHFLEHFEMMPRLM